MSNQATWNCTYCGRVDNTGSTCPSCGANRPQVVNPPVNNYYTPENNAYAPDSVIPQAPQSVATAGRAFWGIANGCALLFMIPFLCAGIFIIGVTVSQWHDVQALSESGTTIQGVVTSRDVSESKNSSTYNVKYSFTANERTYNDSDTVDRATYQSLKIDSPVKIRYAKSDPTISHIGDNDSDQRAIFFVFTIFSVCWNGFVVLFFVLWLRRVRRRRRLFA